MIGDKVKIRNDLVVNEKYNELDVVDCMQPYIGKVLTVDDVDKYGDYYMAEHDDSFCWNDAMIECEVEDNLYEYCNSDVVNFWINNGITKNNTEREIKGAIVKTGKIVYGHISFEYILVNDECVHIEEI